VRDGFFKAVDEGESAQWRIGHYWHILTASELWREGGYRSAREFLKRESKGKEVPLPSQLSEWAVVAAAFEEQFAVRDGMTRLYDLERILKQKGQPDVEGDPAGVPIGVPQRDGRILQKRFADCTDAELRAALRKRSKKKTRPKSVDAKDLAGRVEPLAGKYGLAWDVEDSKEGALTVTLSGPVPSLEGMLHLSPGPPVDARHAMIVEAVNALLMMKRSLDAPLALSAEAGDTGAVYYALGGVGEKTYAANFDAAKQALEQVLTQLSKTL
jgi:hypothetical protein